MTFDEAIAYLSGLSKEGWKLSLDRIQALCAEFNHPERKYRSVHIGGTNGKGSVAKMIAQVLQESGHRTGLYLSPYVNNIRERVQVNGGMIPECEFARLMTRIVPVADKLAKKKTVGQPTEFEIKTILAYLYFAEQNCEFAVAEVGLGGRFDATNVLYPEVTVITNVTLDHTDRLGNTVAEIAAEKAGIIKNEIPCVTGATGDALHVIAQKCKEQDAAIWRLDNEIVCSVEDGRFSVRVGRHAYENLSVKMKGDHQIRNAALAVGAIDQLIREHIPITDHAIQQGLASASLPGRFEIVQENPTLVLDGAHNPAKTEALAKTLQKEYPDKKAIFVYGAVKGHDLENSMKPLLPLASKLYATEPKDRKVPAEETAEIARKHLDQVEVVTPVPAAVEAALAAAGPNDLVCVTGSLYVVGEVSRRIAASENAA